MSHKRFLPANHGTLGPHADNKHTQSASVAMSPISHMKHTHKPMHPKLSTGYGRTLAPAPSIPAFLVEVCGIWSRPHGNLGFGCLRTAKNWSACGATKMEMAVANFAHTMPEARTATEQGLSWRIGTKRTAEGRRVRAKTHSPTALSVFSLLRSWQAVCSEAWISWPLRIVLVGIEVAKPGYSHVKQQHSKPSRALVQSLFPRVRWS